MVISFWPGGYIRRSFSWGYCRAYEHSFWFPFWPWHKSSNNPFFLIARQSHYWVVQPLIYPGFFIVWFYKSCPAKCHNLKCKRIYFVRVFLPNNKLCTSDLYRRISFLLMPAIYDNRLRNATHEVLFSLIIGVMTTFLIN